MDYILNENNILEVRVPNVVCSDYNSYAKLLEMFNCYLNEDCRQYDYICTNFRENTWFDANLLPIVFAYVKYGNEKFNIKSIYDNQKDCEFHKLMVRNQFAKLCFGLEHQPRNRETVVPFKIFNAGDTYGFGAYIDSEIVRYFPHMEDRVKKDLSTYIQELFGNAQIHGNCRNVFTCGQYYPQKGKMDFTIVNLGTTIRENVEGYLIEQRQSIPDNTIEWAVEPEHSTKRTNSGGIGLSLMRDFIMFNHGKYQIVSGNEFWELNQQRVVVSQFTHTFPGTIVNIEIDQNDKKFYQYVLKEPIEDLF